MIRADFHVHTRYCDGRDTPEEMIRAALRKGFQVLGFSGHSFTAFDLSCCMSREATLRYRAELAALREKYRGKLEILVGIEQDYYATDPAEGYDYIIGSVHYLETGGQYLTLDNTAAELAEGIDRCFGGDPYRLAGAYYQTVAQVVEQTRADIIGHFDLITRFQEEVPLFDPMHPRYREASEEAVRRLIPYGVPFEVNTGAMARGYRTAPYPSERLLRLIRELGGEVILTSDCHDRRYLGYAFDQATALLKKCGFTRAVTRTQAGFAFKTL